MSIDAVVLAGGLLKRRICLWKFNKKPVIVHVLEKLAASANIGKIAVVGSRRLEQRINAFAAKNIVYCPEGKNIVDNAEIGAKILDSYHKPCLFIAADLPLLETRHIDDFITKAMPEFEDYDFFYSIARDKQLSSYEAQSVVKRKYVKSINGNFVAGNMVICNPSRLGNRSLVKRAYEYRNIRYVINKLIWCVLFTRVATEFWFRHYVLRNVSFDYINSGMSALLGTRFTLVKLDYPEPSIDVDNPSDYFRIRKYLMNKK